MKKQLLSFAILIFAVALFSSCSKSNSSTPAANYPSGQGKITGTGNTSFTITGTASLFSRTVDTIVVKADIDPSPNVGKQFILGVVAKAPGTYNFINAVANPFASATSGAIAFYTYETVNAAGTIIAHEFVTSSGTVVITSVSATGVTGTYNATLGDFNNNNDAPINISGSFTGSF